MTLMNKEKWKAYINERKLVDPNKYLPKESLYSGLWEGEALKQEIRDKLLKIEMEEKEVRPTFRQLEEKERIDLVEHRNN